MTKLCIRIGILAAAMWLPVSVSQVGAEELKWRQAMHNVKAELVQVCDVPGHVVGAGANGGLAFFNDGAVALVSNQFTIDYTNGSGTHHAYNMYTFDDGSTFVTDSRGTTTADQASKTVTFKGTSAFTRGTGRFTGIQGEGAYTGRRFAPLPGVGAELYIENTATYTLAR